MDALALLRNVSEAYRALQTLAVEASLVTESGDENNNQRSEQRVRFLYAAPDRIRYYTLGNKRVTQVADGEYLHSAFGAHGIPGASRYMKTPVAQMHHLPHLFRPDFPLAGGDDPFLFIGIDERVTAAQHLRDEDGCHVVSVESEPPPHPAMVAGSAILYWIDAKTLMVMRQQGDMGHRFPTEEEVHWTRHTTAVRRILIDDPLPHDAFVFTPPPGVVEEPGGVCGVTTGGGGGFSMRRPDGQGIEHRSSHAWEGDTLVERSRWKTRGVTLDFERRLTFSPGDKELRIEERVTGPKGETATNLTLPLE